MGGLALVFAFYSVLYFILFLRTRKSVENRKKAGAFFCFCFVFSKLQWVLDRWIFFAVVKSYSISPLAMTFNHRMISFIIRLRPHCTLVTVRLQCTMKKAWFLWFSRSSLSPIWCLEVWKNEPLFLEEVLNLGSKNLYWHCWCVELLLMVVTCIHVYILEFKQDA